MATQQEELRLTITLVDDASAGLARIGAQWRQLSSGSTASHIESFRQHQSEIGEQMKQLAEAATRGERAMLGFVGKLGIAGFAFAKVTELVGSGLRSLSEFSDSVVDLGNKARAIGIAPGVLKNIEEEFVRIGGTVAGADQNVARFNEAYAEMGRVGSERRAELIRNAGASGRGMEAGIDSILRQRGTIAQINEVLAQGQIVYNNRLKETHGNVADATKLLRDYLATWGIDPTFAQIEHIREQSKEEQDLSEQRLKNAIEFHKQMADLHKEWNEWMADIGDSMAGIVTPALQKIVELIKEARGAGAIELPRTGEPEDIVGKYGGGGAPSGAAAPLPLLEQGLPRESEDYFKTLKENTRELKKLNDKLDFGAAPSSIGGGMGGGGIGGFGGGVTPSAARGGGGTPGGRGGGATPGGRGGGATPSIVAGGGGGTPGVARGGGGTPAGIGGGATPSGGGAGDGGATGAISGGATGGAVASARSLLGKREDINNADIQEYLRTGGHGMDPAKVPWCAAFVGAALEKGGQHSIPASRGGNLATSYLDWGQHVNPADVRAGDIAVIGRGGGPPRRGAKGHIGLVTGPAVRGRVPTIEGNIGNRVGTSSERVGPTEFRRGFTPQSADRRAIDPSADRRAIDAKRRKTVKVEASGKLGVNISPEQGSAAGNERKLFKPTEPERQSQMVPAQSGPIGAAA